MVDPGHDYVPYYTGEPIPLNMVQEGRMHEVPQKEEFDVGKWVTDTRLPEDAALLETRWIDAYIRPRNSTSNRRAR